MKFLFFALGILCLSGLLSSGLGLLLGVAVAVTLGNPFIQTTKLWTHRLLSLSVIGLGFGMNLKTVMKAGADGVGYTVIGISSAIIIGLTLGRILKVERTPSWLVTVGTAICGGSAIAALAPTIRAKSQDASIALGTVFLLNAAALFIFPAIGHHFNMTEDQFGLWSALAIHDTSSVVGATIQYGAHAVEVGTTVKLARALWIVPLTFAIGYYWNRKQTAEENVAPAKKPWFILGFLIAAALNTYLPDFEHFDHFVEVGARRLMILTLFLIGSNLTLATLKSVGIKPLLQGLFLWIIMGGGTLAFILL